MSVSTVYGIKNDKTIDEIGEVRNGMAACLPIWRTLHEKYISGQMNMFVSKMEVWGLEPTETTPEEYMTLLASFDGYFIKKEDIDVVRDLLEKAIENGMAKHTRIEMLDIMKAHPEYDRYFITATSAGDYSDFFIPKYDEFDDVENVWISDDVWDLYDSYKTDMEN